MINFTSMYTGMGGAMNSVNVHQHLKQRYGCGYEDFGNKPYKQGYPMGIVPREKKTPVQQNAFIKFLIKIFG